MRFHICGPFEVPRKTTSLITRDAKERQAFWDSVAEIQEDLPDACGCYVFSIRNRPWYVGLAEKRSFRNECLAPHKITKFDSALAEGKGRPMLFLIAKLTPADRWAKPGKNGHVDIRWLEKLLIGMAVARNPLLENVRGTKLLREMNVPGILNNGQGQACASAVQGLRTVLGV